MVTAELHEGVHLTSVWLVSIGRDFQSDVIIYTLYFYYCITYNSITIV